MVFLALPGYNIPYYIPLFLSSNLGRKGIPEAPAFHMANDSNHGPQHTEGSWGDVCFVETQANCHAGKIPDRITDHLTQNNFKSARNQGPESSDLQLAGEEEVPGGRASGRSEGPGWELLPFFSPRVWAGLSHTEL